MEGERLFLLSAEVKAYIKENLNVDPIQLILRPPPKFKEGIKEIAGQILARQKAKGKLDDWASNLDLIMPPPVSIEQASSAATCSYKQNFINGNILVDLTGGMGADCLALSDRFERTIYVEKDPTLCAIFQHNVNVLKKNISVVNNTAESFLRNFDQTKNETTIYLDPARRDDQTGRVFRIEDCSPNVLKILPLLRQCANQVIIKFSPLLDIASIVKSLPQISGIHVVSVKNECKEILVEIDFTSTSVPPIHCINLKTPQPSYSFHLQAEMAAIPRYETLGNYLYEPNSSIMKASAFKKVGVDFALGKLGANTHLYTSEYLNPSFPGRVFKVIAEVSTKEIPHYAPKGKIHVITRNYPLTTNELKKKWRLKDGGNYFLIAFRDNDNFAKTFIAERMNHPI